MKCCIPMQRAQIEIFRFGICNFILILLILCLPSQNDLPAVFQRLSEDLPPGMSRMRLFAAVSIFDVVADLPPGMSRMRLRKTRMLRYRTGRSFIFDVSAYRFFMFFFDFASGLCKSSCAAQRNKITAMAAVLSIKVLRCQSLKILYHVYSGSKV